MSVIGFLASFNTEVEGSWPEGPLRLEFLHSELCLNSIYLPERMAPLSLSQKWKEGLPLDGAPSLPLFVTL